MVSEAVITAIMAASVTGAGLVIAFYALIARMSDRIFAHRLEQLEEGRREIKEITSSPESFKEENLKKTNKRLEDIRKEITSMKTYPKYLGLGVIFDFMFFFLSAVFSIMWLAQIMDVRSDAMILIIFFIAVFTFLAVGIYGIFDVHFVMVNDFKKLTERKEELQVELKEAPQEAKIVEQVAQFLIMSGRTHSREVSIKTNGERFFADFIIYIKEKPEYIVEVLTKPTSQNVYRTAEKLETYKLVNSMKTILISDFSQNAPAKETATAYWDFVVDVKNLNELKEIIN